MHKISSDSMKFVPLPCDVVFMVLPLRPFHAYPHRFVGLNNYKHISSCVVPILLQQVLPVQFTEVEVYKVIAVGIGISNSPRAFFIVRLSSSSSGSIKKMPRTLLGSYQSFGFSIAHFCLSLRFDASDMCVHISGHTLSGLEVVCFLVSLLPDHVYPSGGLSSSNKMNLMKPVHASDNFLSPSTFQ